VAFKLFIVVCVEGAMARCLGATGLFALTVGAMVKGFGATDVSLWASSVTGANKIMETAAVIRAVRAETRMYISRLLLPRF
jgi:hypothetical protein